MYAAVTRGAAQRRYWAFYAAIKEGNMPIYEYQCDACGKCFETLVMGGKAPKTCELCGAKKIHRVLSACGFQTKDKSGLVTKSAAGASACAGCTASSCASCK